MPNFDEMWNQMAEDDRTEFVEFMQYMKWRNRVMGVMVYVVIGLSIIGVVAVLVVGPA